MKTKKQILSLIESINTILGTSFEIENVPHYGGYSMFEKTATGSRSFGYFGFESRKSAGETYNYLLGIYYSLTYIASQNANK